MKALDSVAEEYLFPTPDRLVDRAILNMVADYVIGRLPGERALELGIGDQVWTEKLCAWFPSVTTVDGSLELVTQLQEKGYNAVWSLFENYVPEEKFDIVVATYVLEHVDDPELILYLTRENWLEEGGYLAVVVPHALSLHRRLAVAMGLSSYPGQLGESDIRMGHQHCFTCFEMERLLTDYGFSVVLKKGMFSKILPNRFLSKEHLQGLFKLGLSLPIEYSALIFFLAHKHD